MSKIDKIRSNRRRHEFLLTLFPDKEEKYSMMEINGYILIRQWNGGSGLWEVAIHTPETYASVQKWQQEHKFK